MTTSTWASDRDATPRILLRSSWQVANIGDVAHTPGALKALTEALPGAEIRLWPVQLDDRETAMLSRLFPEVRIVHGQLDDAGRASTPELAEAVRWADLFVHGSAPSVLAARSVRSWLVATRQKPYGFFGITIDPFAPTTGGTLGELEAMINALPAGYLEEDLHTLLSRAAFVYCRDPLTLTYLRSQGVGCPVLAFGPDATFAFDYGDTDGGDHLLEALGLAGRDFICMIPRVRFVPYHEINKTEPSREQSRRSAINAAHTDDDIAQFVGVVEGWVRTTQTQVLLAPEMSYVVQFARDRVLPLLSAPALERVRLVDEYWDLEVATEVYRRSRMVVSMDCHSPILATAVGTPSMYLRLPTETVKGAMFVELGTTPVVEMGSGSVDEALAHMRDVLHDPEGAFRSVDAARRRAHELLGAMSRQTALAARKARPPSPTPPAGGRQ